MLSAPTLTVLEHQKDFPLQAQGRATQLLKGVKPNMHVY